MLDPAEVEELAIFRDAARKFMEREVAPNADRWRAEGMVDRDFSSSQRPRPRQKSRAYSSISASRKLPQAGSMSSPPRR